MNNSQMTTITLRRHPLNFYTVLAISFLGFIVMGAGLVGKGIKGAYNAHNEVSHYLLALVGLGLVWFAFKMVYSYYRNVPIVIISQHTIQIGSQTFRLEEITDVALKGKMVFPFLLSFLTEGTAMLFQDGTEKVLYDSLYSNSHELKSFLEQVVLKKQEYVPIVVGKVSQNKFLFEGERKFLGNQFTSGRGMSLWIIAVMFGYILVTSFQPLSIWESLMFVFCMYLFKIHTGIMRYFGLTKDHLIIRTHNLPWPAKLYRFEDIKEVVFETQGQLPNCMRVITNDYRSSLYGAGTLRDKTWLELKRQLEFSGVAVRNECIREE
jgi:hypothetical protein